MSCLKNIASNRDSRFDNCLGQELFQLTSEELTPSIGYQLQTIEQTKILSKQVERYLRVYNSKQKSIGVTCFRLGKCCCSIWQLSFSMFLFIKLVFIEILVLLILVINAIIVTRMKNLRHGAISKYLVYWRNLPTKEPTRGESRNLAHFENKLLEDKQS